MGTRLTKRLQLDYSKILVAIFELMMRSGIRAKDLLPVCVKSVGHAATKSRLSRSDESGGLVTAALVLDAWHRDRRYLTMSGTPRPVRLLGPAPSVEALVRLQRSTRHTSDVARRLEKLRLVVPCGRRLYKPASDAAVISARDPFILQHAARALLTLVETVHKNIDQTRDRGPLIERFAEVPDLPRKHIAEFQTFTQTQGRTFLRTVNDWLESRRVRRSSRRVVKGTVRAGIHTYAYVISAPRRMPSHKRHRV
jgi:hypothetical protein